MTDDTPPHPLAGAPTNLPATDVLPATILQGLLDTDVVMSAETTFTGEAPGQWIGRYHLIEKLGEGGFGVVWRAEQKEPVRREVALKVVKAGMASAEILARFAAERQALTVMEHPNIATLLDAGQTETGQPFFVMSLVRGLPITTYCDQRCLDLRKRLVLFSEVCEAVEHAHRRGILHRDLKPSNILVEDIDGRPSVRVIDFGIAKVLGADQQGVEESMALTGKGLAIGTPQYMSPEQAGSRPDVDTRSDVYALGAVLYELLTGTPPLEKSRLKQAAWDEVLRLIREAEVVRPSSKLIPLSVLSDTLAAQRQTTSQRLAASVRGELDWIVLKALEKDRDRRYGGAAALAEDVRRYLQGEPVAAGPPSGAYRIKKFVRRHWLPVSAAAAVVVSLAGGGAASLWQWNVARRAEAASTDSLHRLLGVEIADSMRRGDAGKAIDLIGEARKAGYLDQDELLLHEIQAREATSDPSVPELVASLDAAKLAPSQRPRLDFWKAERMIQDGRTEEGQKLLRAAIAAGLPEVENALAHGILSESAAEAIGHYERVAALAPWNVLTQRNLVLALLLSGRIDEARARMRLCQTLFPEDRDFFVYEALLHAFQASPDAGLAALERIPKPDDPAKALFLPLIEPLSSFSSDIVLALCGAQPKISMMGQYELTKAVGSFTVAAGQRGSAPGMKGVAPALTRGMKGLIDALWKYQNKVTGEAAVTSLRETLRTNDEGTLWAVLGAIEIHRKNYREAADACRRAQTAPALIYNIGNAARLGEGAAEAGIYAFIETPGSPERAGALERAGAAFSDAVASDLPDEVFSSGALASLVRVVALKLPDRLLARRVASRMLQNSSQQLVFMAQIEYAEGNRTKALEIAERAIALHPDDAAIPALAASIRAGTLEVTQPDPPPK